MEKRKSALSLIVVVIALALFVACLAYLCSYYKAKDVEKFFSDGDGVRVEEAHDYYYFDGPGTEKAFVFYPGARVDTKAYAPLMRRLAEEGIDCYLMCMPFHMAIFNVKAADRVIGESHAEWYIGGHSMGGAMAASYVGGTQKHIDGLILLAAYSATDLKGTNVPALAVYGDKDGVLNRDKLAGGRDYFSEYTEKAIAGGNHAQFGSYGKQKGDNDASISADTQTELTVQYILEFTK